MGILLYAPNISKFILSKESRRYTCPVYYALNAVLQASFKHSNLLNISKYIIHKYHDLTTKLFEFWPYTCKYMYAKSLHARMISLFQEGNKIVSDVI